MAASRPVFRASLAIVLIASVGLWASAAAPTTQPSEPPATDGPRIQSQLDHKIPELKFYEVAFSDVIDKIRDAADMKIDVKWEVLKAAGIAKNSPATMRLFNVKASKAIQVAIDSISTPKVMLHSEIDLANDQLVITTYDEYVARNTEEREYDIHDLIRNVDGPKMEAKLIDDLSKLICEVVAPESWVADGGKPGVIKAKDRWLTITQTRENHRRIEDLMAQLRETIPRDGQEQQQSNRSTPPAGPATRRTP